MRLRNRGTLVSSSLRITSPSSRLTSKPMPRNVCFGSSNPCTFSPAKILLYSRLSAALPSEVSKLYLAQSALSAAPRSPFVNAPRLANLRAMVELKRFSPPSSVLNSTYSGGSAWSLRCVRPKHCICLSALQPSSSVTCTRR